MKKVFTIFLFFILLLSFGFVATAPKAEASFWDGFSINIGYTGSNYGYYDYYNSYSSYDYGYNYYNTYEYRYNNNYQRNNQYNYPRYGDYYGYSSNSRYSNNFSPYGNYNSFRPLCTMDPCYY